MHINIRDETQLHATQHVGPFKILPAKARTIVERHEENRINKNRPRSLLLAYLEGMRIYSQWRMEDLVNTESNREDLDHAWEAIWEEVLSDQNIIKDFSEAERRAIFRLFNEWIQANSPYHYRRGLLLKSMRDHAKRMSFVERIQASIRQHCRHIAIIPGNTPKPGSQ